MEEFHKHTFLVLVLMKYRRNIYQNIAKKSINIDEFLRTIGHCSGKSYVG